MVSMALLLSPSFLLLLFLLPSASAVLICEELPPELCAFAISSSSKRCVLESSQQNGGGPHTEYQCRTSEVVVERMSELIETDECVRACGVDRGSVGISSDSLLEPRLAEKLCSPACYQNCPNIIDLYFNLAAAEGVFLPDLCEAGRLKPRRAMEELLLSSSAGAATAPSGSQIGEAPSEAYPPLHA